MEYYSLLTCEVFKALLIRHLEKVSFDNTIFMVHFGRFGLNKRIIVRIVLGYYGSGFEFVRRNEMD